MNLIYEYDEAQVRRIPEGKHTLSDLDRRRLELSEEEANLDLVDERPNT
jgi:hypothetical protein